MTATKTKRKTAKKAAPKARKPKAVKAVAPVAAPKPAVKPHSWTDGGDKVLILRRCNPDGSSSHNFTWPAEGHVEFADFNPQAVCGGGGHGWPWGMGLGEGSDYDIIDDRWLVIAAMPGDVVGELDRGEKCKVRACEIAYCGQFAGAWAMINGGRHRLIEAMSKTGDEIASGDYSTAASSGDSSTAASSGHSSTAAHEGKSGIAASIGADGKAKAGENGLLIVCWWDAANERYRACVGEVGIDGIKADTWYSVKDGKLTEAK